MLDEFSALDPLFPFSTNGPFTRSLSSKLAVDWKEANVLINLYMCATLLIGESCSVPKSSLLLTAQVILLVVGVGKLCRCSPLQEIKHILLGLNVSITSLLRPETFTLAHASRHVCFCPCCWIRAPPSAHLVTEVASGVQEPLPEPDPRRTRSLVPCSSPIFAFF